MTVPVSARAVARKVALKRGRKELHAHIAHQFRLLCKAHHLPMPTTEYRFDPDRRWRFDYAWIPERVALEVDGGIFVRGAHTRGARILKTHEKLNRAAALNWRVLYRVPDNLATDDTLDLLVAVFERRSVHLLPPL